MAAENSTWHIMEIMTATAGRENVVARFKMSSFRVFAKTI